MLSRGRGPAVLSEERGAATKESRGLMCSLDDSVYCVYKSFCRLGSGHCSRSARLGRVPCRAGTVTAGASDAMAGPGTTESA